MSEKEHSHNDIYQRVEKVEIDVAVLDSKSNRLHEDLVSLKADTRVNGEIARATSTKVDALPKNIGIMLTVIGLVLSGIMVVTRIV